MDNTSSLTLVLMFCFSLCSGGPHVHRDKLHFKDMAVAGICADGFTLPLVLFIPWYFPPDHALSKCTYCLCCTTVSPSSELMRRWFDTIRDYLEDQPLLF